jgi:hypothetical protein
LSLAPDWQRQRQTDQQQRDAVFHSMSPPRILKFRPTIFNMSDAIVLWAQYYRKVTVE